MDRLERHRKALSVGLTVKIKRSSGLVHEASVTGIDSEKRLVSVEWYESGETKGKEVDINQLIQLNPHFGSMLTPPVATTKSASSRRTILSPMPNSVSQ
jgi:kinesin family protein 2/24